MPSNAKDLAALPHFRKMLISPRRAVYPTARIKKTGKGLKFQSRQLRPYTTNKLDMDKTTVCTC